MAYLSHSELAYGKYDCTLEVQMSRNRSILTWLVVGVGWAILFFGVIQVQWFAFEALDAHNEMSSSSLEPVQPCDPLMTDCENTSSFNGGIWWSLLAVFLTSVGVAPLAIALLILRYRTKDVTKEWKEQLYSITLFAVPFTCIWALLWLICLPYTWTLLPWGDWSTNWWKIFPFGFGLIWMGCLPLFFSLRQMFSLLLSPQYNGAEQISNSESEAEHEEKEESGSTASEFIDPVATHSEERSANGTDAEFNTRATITTLVIGLILFIIGLPLFIGSEQENLGMLIPGAIAFGVGGFLIVVASIALISSWAKSYAETGKPVPRWTKLAPVFAVLLLIPGVVLLIVGGIAAENFEHYGVSTATLELEDVDMLGDQGFIIFVKGTPGDNNGNGVHDYCEDIIVNATHSGDWMSSPWNAESTPNAADETRQVFELEISHEGSGCDAQHWPKEKWKNDTQLVKIGRACYGCMAGNTTITAEYESSDGINPPASMWIQDGEVLVGSTVMTIFGAIFAGIGTLTLIGFIGIILKLKEETSKGLEEEKEPIEIIGHTAPNHSVLFRINDPPKGRDAWVGIYPVSTGDQDHGGRWSWLRDIDVNNATLPGQPAGKWSIRVFKDGGYKLQNRVDFEIHSPHQQPSTSTSSEGTVAGNTTITTSKSTYTIDEGIDFSFTASKLPDDAWIGIVPVAIPHGDEAVNDSHDTSYEYLGGRTKGNITLPNPGLGTWTLRLHDTDNNGRELTHVVFVVVSSLGSSERLHQSGACEIHILEATMGKPIRFNVRNRPSGNEAWFGLYPERATDHEHGNQHQNWMYFRDVGQNELSLPAKSAGRWSIRVFSDGGFNMIKRLDFDIIEVDKKSTQSAQKIQSMFRQPAVYKTPAKSMPSSVTVSGAGSSEVNGTYVFKPGKHENRHFSTIAGHYQHTQNPEIFIAFQDCGTNHQRPEWNKWMIISKIGVLYAAHTGGKIGVPPREGVWENVEWGHPGAPGGKHPAPTVRHGEQAVKGSSSEEKTNFWDSIE